MRTEISKKKVTNAQLAKKFRELYFRGICRGMDFISGITLQAPNAENLFFNINGPSPVMTSNPPIQERMEFWNQLYGRN